jgi:hypothetical protein
MDRVRGVRGGWGGGRAGAGELRGQHATAAAGVAGADGGVDRTGVLGLIPPPRAADASFGQYEGYPKHTSEDGTKSHNAPTAATVTVKIGVCSQLLAVPAP